MKVEDNKEEIIISNILNLLVYKFNSDILVEMEMKKFNITELIMIINEYEISNKEEIIDYIIHSDFFNDGFYGYLQNDIDNLVLFYLYNDKLYVVGRGTVLKEVDNILTDINVLPKIIDKENDIIVHNGFYDILFNDDFFKKIYKFIVDINPKKLFLTGHSMGTFVCLISYFMLLDNYENIINVITFGCTRIGNKNFVESFYNLKNLNIINIVNEYDIVPRLFGLQYSYFNSYCFIKNNEIIECYDNCEIYKKLFLNVSIDDHHIYKYLSNIWMFIN